MTKTKRQPSHRRSAQSRTTTAMQQPRHGRGHLRVDARPELRAEPDWDRFAWALLQYVRAKREAARTGGSLDE